MGTITDPIADMLTRIRNANRANHDHVLVPASKVKQEILRILKDEGFIADFKVTPAEGRQGTIRVNLRYGPRKEPVLMGIQRVSKSGLRVYAKRRAVPRVQAGLGVAILTTSKGIMTDKQARAAGVGGEVICYAW
jgi:small subunit ribosomal protein S8